MDRDCCTELLWSKRPREVAHLNPKTPHSDDRRPPILPPAEPSDKNDLSSPPTPQSTRPARPCAPSLHTPLSMTPAPGSPPIPVSLTAFYRVERTKAERGGPRLVTDLWRVHSRPALTRWYDKDRMDAEWTAGRHMAQNSTQPTWDAAALATQMGKIAEQSQQLVQDFLFKRPEIARLGMGDATTLGGAFIELTTKMMTDAAAIARTQIGLFNDGLRVWQTTAERLMGRDAAPEEPPQDKRFKHPDWTEYAVFYFIKESYLIWAKAVLAAVHGVEG